MNISINGFLIHARDYKESSSIINIFSSEKGLQSLIFKGKNNNKDRFQFSVFNEYAFSFNDSYSLPYLSKFEIVNEHFFNKNYYLLGLYLNELLYKTLKEGYDFEKIYNHYREFLVYLSATSDSSTRLALLFEKSLMQDLGYEITMANNKSINQSLSYIYDFDQGFICSPSLETELSVSGYNLSSFFNNTLTCEKSISILRSIIREILKEVYPNINLMGDRLF